MTTCRTAMHTVGTRGWPTPQRDPRRPSPQSSRCSARLAAGVLALVLAVAGCGSDDDPAPTQSKADLLRGTWYLEATEGDSDVASLVAVSWLFTESGEVRQRVGGPFLRALRDLQVVQDALAGQDLGAAERVDGGNLNWTGTWSLDGDSLHVRYDRVVVEVFGDVPLLGRITLPVSDEPLDPGPLTELGYAYRFEADTLVVEGAAPLAGLGADGQAATLTGQLEGPAGAAALAALDLLAVQLQGLDTQRWVRR